MKEFLKRLRRIDRDLLRARISSEPGKKRRLFWRSMWNGKYIRLDFGDFHLIAYHPRLFFKQNQVFGWPVSPVSLPLESVLSGLENPDARNVLSKILQMFYEAIPPIRKAVSWDLRRYLLGEIPLVELARRAGVRYRNWMLRRRVREALFFWSQAVRSFVRRIGNDYILAIPLEQESEEKVVFITPSAVKETSNLTLAGEIMFLPNPEKRLKRLREAKRETCEKIVLQHTSLEKSFPEAFALLLAKSLLEGYGKIPSGHRRLQHNSGGAGNLLQGGVHPRSPPLPDGLDAQSRQVQKPDCEESP